MPFNDAEFDLVSISFGLRNITEKDIALGEIYRVLKKGGRFMCLEFSKVNIVSLNLLLRGSVHYCVISLLTSEKRV